MAANVEELTGRAPGTARGFSPSPMIPAVLGVMCTACAVMVVVLGLHLTFFNDDWYFMLQRPGNQSHGGLDVLLAPENGHFVFLSVLLFKAWVAIWGLGSQLPFRMLMAVFVCGCGVTIFLLVSERAGYLVGLASAAVVLFLGAAWEDLLFITAGITDVPSVATGLGALWAIERDTQRSRVLACFLLLCSLSFCNVGLPFAGAAVVAVAVRRRWTQLLVPFVPLAVFGLWWLTEGSREAPAVPASNIEHLPGYVLDSAAAALASVTGLARGANMMTYARIELGIAVAVVLVCIWRGLRPRITLLVPLSGAVVFWLLTGINYMPGRAAYSSRYQLISGVFLILIAAELLRGVRLSRTVNVAIVLATIAVVASNLQGALAFGYRTLHQEALYAKAELGAMKIAQPFVASSFVLNPDVAQDRFLSGVTAGRLFAVTRVHGFVPAYTSNQIAASSAKVRRAVDDVLAFAERIPPAGVTAGPVDPSSCSRLTAGTETVLAPGGWQLTDTGGSGAVISLRRFAPAGNANSIGLLAPGKAAKVSVPADGVTVPWRLSFAARQGTTFEVCRPKL